MHRFTRRSLPLVHRHWCTTSTLTTPSSSLLPTFSCFPLHLKQQQQQQFHSFPSHQQQKQQTQQQIPHSEHQLHYLYKSPSSTPILYAQQAYIRHRNIIWLTLGNLFLHYLPVAPLLKMITILGSIVVGYFSKRNNRNHIPVMIKSIALCNASTASQILSPKTLKNHQNDKNHDNENDDDDDEVMDHLLLERFDGTREVVQVRDVIMDHEALFKVYMPFGSFFWRSFLLNKDDMRVGGGSHELRFMVVRLGDHMREDTRHLEFNLEGEVVRSVYTVRSLGMGSSSSSSSSSSSGGEDDDEAVDRLREKLEAVRSRFDPPAAQ